MKRKVVLFLVLLLTLFSFTNVDAKVTDVSIKSVDLVEKVGTAEEINSAKFEGMDISYNVIFKKKDDAVKYKVTIQNKGNEDIFINNKGEIGNSDYILYDYEWDDNENIIKGNSEKTFGLSIIYKKEVDNATLAGGKYEESKDLEIKISDQKGNTLPPTNPDTDSNISIFLILLSIEILAVISVAIYLIKNKKLNIESIRKMKKANIISIVLFLLLVLGTTIGYSYALEVAEIKVNSRIVISKARLARSCLSDSYAIDYPYTQEDERKLLEAGDNQSDLDDYNNDFCLDWANILPEPSSALNFSANDYNPTIGLVTKTAKNMTSIYTYQGKRYELMETFDVSDLQNGEVILGLYYNYDSDDGLFVLGQDGGVLAPVDSSWLFGTIGPISYNPDEGEPIENFNVQSMLEMVEGEDSNLDIDADIDIDINIESDTKLGINFKKNLQENIMTEISYLDLSNIDFSETNNMSGMFAFNGSYVDEWTLKGITNWNTSSVEDMSIMFTGVGQNTDKVNIYDIDKLNTSNVRIMEFMFASALNYIDSFNISNWNVEKVEDMIGMFAFSLNSLSEFDISKWNVSNLKYGTGMFALGLNNLEKFDINNWDVSNLSNMGLMFTNSLHNIRKFDISKWSPRKVTGALALFSGAFDEDIELYINNFPLENLKGYTAIFDSLSSNVKIYVSKESQKDWILNLSVEDGNRPDWDTDNIIVI